MVGGVLAESSSKTKLLATHPVTGYKGVGSHCVGDCEGAATMSQDSSPWYLHKLASTGLSCWTIRAATPSSRVCPARLSCHGEPEIIRTMVMTMTMTIIMCMTRTRTRTRTTTMTLP